MATCSITLPMDIIPSGSNRKELGNRLRTSASIKIWSYHARVNKGLGAWNTMKIVRAGSNYSFYLNGYLIYSFSDSSFDPGVLRPAFLQRQCADRIALRLCQARHRRHRRPGAGRKSDRRAGYGPEFFRSQLKKRVFKAGRCKSISSPAASPMDAAGWDSCHPYSSFFLPQLLKQLKTPDIFLCRGS